MSKTPRNHGAGRLFQRLLSHSVAPLALAASLAAPLAVMAQQTTSSISGQVVDSSGKPAVGTQVVVTHLPSGTVANTDADSTGRFSASGLRVGGP